jgi:tRNA (adenine22-N1)-methyltransferase
MELSIRLRAIADMVSENCVMADVGTDHAHLPVFLVRNKKATHAIAMDIAKGPLKNAQAFIRQNHMEDKIETRLSDGVEKLQAGEVDTVVIAGMGGPLIRKIVQAGERLWDDITHWILSPQSELPQTRSFLYQSGFRVEAEEVVYDMGKYYVVWDVVRGEAGEASELDLWFGERLLKQKHPVLKQYILQREKVLQRILENLQEADSEQAKEKQKEIQKQYALIAKAKAVYDTN